jgi:ABC-2 type transport system permease protein
VTLPFLLGSLGIGLLISVVSKTQIQAQQLTQFTLLPAMLLSGFFAPRESMPSVLRLLSTVIPMTYYLQVLRGILVKGVGLDVLWPQALGLSVFGVVVLGIAVQQSRKRLD